MTWKLKHDSQSEKPNRKIGRESCDCPKREQEDKEMINKRKKVRRLKNQLRMFNNSRLFLREL